MKYYSEKLNKLFITEEELRAAEEKVEAARKAKEQKEKELKETREARAKAVEEAFKIAMEARDKANKLLAEFTEDYGSFHHTFHGSDSASSLFDLFFSIVG